MITQSVARPFPDRLSWLLLIVATAGVAATPDERALWEAAKKDSVRPVEALLAKGVAVDAVNSSGRTALWIAAEKNRVYVVDRLLKAGADFERPDRKGVTPFDVARNKGHGEITTQFALAAAARTNTIEAYRGFIKGYPNSRFVPGAYQGIEKLEWAAATGSQSSVVMRQFLKAHPDSARTNDALMLIEQYAWNELQSNPKADVPGYRRFIAEFPKGTRVALAQGRIADIERQQAEAVLQRLSGALVRIKTAETRAVQRWYDGMKLSGDMLACVLQPGQCITRSELLTRKAGPKPGHTFLLVEADVVLPESMSVVENDICTLATVAGTVLKPHVWSPLGSEAGWTSARMTVPMESGKKETMRWLFEVPDAQLHGARVKIWSKEFAATEYR